MAGNAKQDGGRGRSRWRIAAWATAAVVLLLPLVAMPFTDEVTWSVFDFVFAGTLIVATGAIAELAVRKTRNGAYRAAAGVALAAAFILVWGNAAVGVIGPASHDANLLYPAVPAVGAIGALLARFRARGMVRAMLATAAAQVLVPVLALVAAGDFAGPVRSMETLVLTAFFAALWLGSAWLFGRSLDDRSTNGNAVVRTPSRS